jgi:eukaryotic-like serine/threonine-protein kinase
MTEFVCRRTGQTYEVGEQLDQNGQALVHAVVSAGPALALKQYLPTTLHKRPDLEARIKAMIANPPAYRPDRAGPVICAWPEDAAYVAGQFAGFVMPRIDTRSAVTIPDLATRHTTTWHDRVAVAENLARAVAVLHEGDVVIGDFRQWNLLAWSDGHVTLLGCDRMQVVDPASHRRFPCVAGRDACTPPELQLPSSLSSTLRTSSSDIFTLALHLHLLLLGGAHPFRGHWRGGGDSPPEQVLAQEGLWTYAGDRRLAPDPSSTPLAALPETFQQFFRAAFVDGARNPEARPPAQDWLIELTHLRESLATPRRLATVTPQRPAAVAATSPVTAPAHHDLGDAETRHLSPEPSHRATPSGTRRLESAPPRRPRSALRLAAWVATAAVAIGGVVGVSTAARRSVAHVADPTASTQTQATSTQPRPDDPTAALEQVRARDAPVVETLAESWVAQLSARPAESSTTDRTATDAAVLAGHETLRRQYSDAVLLKSTDWNYDGQFWITVVRERFSSAEEANDWCDTHHFAAQDCFAKKLSHSGVVEGSAKYRR